MQTPEQISAELYDISVPDWDGELDFYRELAREVKAHGREQSVLEVGCGTGRITIRLAQEGVKVVGTDLSEEMLEIARSKSVEIRWIQGDMRTLDLGEMFDLIIIPGHSFQFMLTPEDQVKALETFRRHLTSDGMLVIHHDHQSVDWLGDLLGELGGKFEQSKDVIHPRTAHIIRRAHAWTYEPSTQTATIVSQWEEISEEGSVLQTWIRKPMPLHCVFRFEMEHLLARTGFEIQTLYGDFFKNELTDKSSEMIWVAFKNENLN
jgi:ubiquinone/menaquinone biosynthesis C-methylase UbiE